MLPQLSIRFNFDDRRPVRSISYQRVGPYQWYEKSDNSIEDRSRTIVVPLLREDIGARTTWSWSRAGNQFFLRHVSSVSSAFAHVTMMTPINSNLSCQASAPLGPFVYDDLLLLLDSC